MAEVLTNIGEEYILDAYKDSGATLIIGLYADADGPDGGTITGADSGIDDSSDISDINSEPSGSYSRVNEAISNTTIDLSGADALIDIPQQDITVTGASETVNAYFVGINFDSDKAGDAGTPVDHLIHTGFLSSSRDLTDTDKFELTEAGGSLN